MHWTAEEIALVVADYFTMLTKELRGEPYNKASHRRALLTHLPNRSKSAVEFKHQNVSAILIELGLPYIKGYVPYYNYQGRLKDEVIAYLQAYPALEKDFKAFVDAPVHRPHKPDYEAIRVEPPQTKEQREEAPVHKRKNPVRLNYLEREQRNAELGTKGEEFILDYEKWRLKSLGKSHWVREVIWIAREEGDEAGYDIRSKTADGENKLIEVKTTRLGKETPIFFTRNELLVSQKHAEHYYLARLFAFDDAPRFFEKQGRLDAVSRPVAISFKGYF